MKNLTRKVAGLPVALLPTMVGAITLSNVYYSVFSFAWIMHLTTIAAMVIWLLAVVKIIIHFDIFLGEYKNPVLASLYAAVTMLLMLFGAYLHPFFPEFGKGLWLAAILLHSVQILIFTYRHLIKSRSWDTFVPTWLVAYLGILVSVAVGGRMDELLLNRMIFYYGLVTCCVLVVFLIYRLSTRPLAPIFLHSKCIFLAPPSLCLVGYLTVMEYINPLVAYLLYAIVLLMFLYFLKNLPAFFSVPFAPGFAGLTFPNAIGIVASLQMSWYLESVGNVVLSQIVREIAGIQIYITTAVIAFVLYKFIKMFADSCAHKEKIEKN